MNSFVSPFFVSATDAGVAVLIIGVLEGGNAYIGATEIGKEGVGVQVNLANKAWFAKKTRGKRRTGSLDFPEEPRG